MKRNSINKRKSYYNRKDRVGLVYILPWFVGTIFFFILPMITAFTYSISKITITPTGFLQKYIGIENYVHFITADSKFVRYWASSVLGMIPQVVLIVSFSIFLAVLIKDKFKGRMFVRSLFFFPVMLASGPVLSILQADASMGSSSTPAYIMQIPSLLTAFEVLNVPDKILTFITDVVNQTFSLTWKSGVQILLMQAAICDIPKSSYEVADIEGATAWEKFWKITFPMISPSFLVVVTYTVIDTFTDYDNQVMTLLRSYYSKGNYSYSTTIGIIYFVSILAVIGIVGLFIKKSINYESD